MTTLKALEPKIQVWITGLALVVGFLCGMLVSYTGFFQPSLKAYEKAVKDGREAQEEDHQLIRELAQRHPETFAEAVRRLPAGRREHFESVVGGR
jgi:hypothetical protein